MRAFETIATAEVPRLLAQWLDSDIAVQPGRDGADLVLRINGVVLVIEVKSSDEIAHQERAARQLEVYTTTHPDAVPVLVVPYMGRRGREHAETRRLCWMDLSGNADIRGPGLRILIEGKPNRFASPGRPSTAFSPKAARVARVVLVQPERWWLHKELIEATGLSGGYVSKVLARLVDDELLERRPTDGSVRSAAPSTLLDAWAQVYDFAKHDIGRFHAVGRSGPEVLETLAGQLGNVRVEWAATGLSAAWQWSRFADFRLTTLFVAEPLLDPLALGLRPVDQGENVWIVTPNDQGVFYAAADVSGVRCVHPVQAYLDLFGHPERAKEAAAALRADKLAWSR